MSKSITISTILFLLMMGTASAYWPVSLENNLEISAIPDTNEMYCTALPYPDGSTLAVFDRGYLGNVYQIIDKYGEFKYDEPQPLTPANVAGFNNTPHLEPDGFGGAVVAWRSWGENPVQGIVAQRLDSLGNLLWGDDGVLISTCMEQGFDICASGDGGLILSICPYETDWHDLYVQRVDSEGNLLWGESGVPVCSLSYIDQDYTRIAPDGFGGAFAIWHDSRSPYSDGAIFCQHVDADGNVTWVEDLFIYEDPWPSYMDIISDGVGGCIIHGGTGSWNHAWRVSLSGDILWERDYVSWYTDAKIVPGEPGFFYLGFTNPLATSNRVYGQRMDIDGNFYWPPYPQADGLVIWELPPHCLITGDRNWSFHYPYFYSVFSYRHSENTLKKLTIQVVDTLGSRLLDDHGVVLTQEDLGGAGSFSWIDVNPSDNGIVAVFTRRNALLDSEWDVMAKRANFDGTLGGPNATIEDITVSVSGEDIILSWQPEAPSAQYHIYKSEEPYIFPTEPDTTIADTFFVDVDALLEGMRFYNVRWEPLE